MKLYHELIIPELEEIQSELYAYLKDFLKTNSKNVIGKAIKYNEITKFPRLLNYLNSISKIPLDPNMPLKFFISSPGSFGSIHMDSDLTSRIALNIPVSGCKNTFLVYYKSIPDNIVYCTPNSYIPKDYSKIHLIEKIEFINPCLVRTDHLHRSINSGKQQRIIASVRWEKNRHLTEFEDFVKI